MDKSWCGPFTEGFTYGMKFHAILHKDSRTQA
jgi:hypothetical protein